MFFSFVKNDKLMLSSAAINSIEITKEQQLCLMISVD
jgi:hypothetical protein